MTVRAIKEHADDQATSHLELAEMAAGTPPGRAVRVASGPIPTVGGTPKVAPKRKILIADDAKLGRRILARCLGEHEVHTAQDGLQAAALLQEGGFDLVISDINMPGMGGIELLRLVRQHYDDLPVILVTASHTAQHASEAVRHRATGYLTKPLSAESIAAEVNRALQLSELARLRKQAQALLSQAHVIEASAEQQQRMDRSLDQLFMVYQPIVSWSRREVYAHEALMRTDESTVPHPGVLLELAEEVDALPALGRRVRDSISGSLAEVPKGSLLFINLHARDLLDDMLFDPSSPLAQASDRVVFEITERADLDSVPGAAGRIASLREMGFRIAIDDIGAGYAGLTSFVTMSPDLVKLDMALVRGIDQDVLRRRLVRSLIDLCRDLGIEVVAEGIETQAERDTLADLGCDLMQGFLFARPDRLFSTTPPELWS